MSDMTERRFTEEQARRLGREIGVDWNAARFDVEQLRMARPSRSSHECQQ
jgi:hypothetical protein